MTIRKQSNNIKNYLRQKKKNVIRWQLKGYNKKWLFEDKLKLKIIER